LLFSLELSKIFVPLNCAAIGTPQKPHIMNFYSEAAARAVNALGIPCYTTMGVYAHGCLQKGLRSDLMHSFPTQKIEAGKHNVLVYLKEGEKIKAYECLLYAFNDAETGRIKGLIVLEKDIEAIEFACTCMAFQSLDVKQFMGICKKIYG
jgi:hypothetical protein